MESMLYGPLRRNGFEKFSKLFYFQRYNALLVLKLATPRIKKDDEYYFTFDYEFVSFLSLGAFYSFHDEV